MAEAGHQNAHALDWVKGELEETLKQAVQSLEFFVENTGDEYELVACAEALHQVIGTLRLVELDAAVRYTEAMVELLDAVREDRVERSEAIFEALMRGLLQLPAYLEYIQSGGADMVEALLPEINELRQLGGQKTLGPAQLFDVALDVEPPAPAQPPSMPLAALAVKARPTYEKALVAWLRNPQDPNAMRVLLRVCELVRQAAPGPEIARLWWAAGGLFEGLGAGAISADSEAKQLLTALDRELKKHAEQGEVDAADADLTRRLLYRVGQAVDAGPLSRELDAAFGLAGKVPSAELVEEVGRRLHGPDTSVLRSVGQAVKEDFNRARDIIEIFAASSDATPADLAPLGENLGRMADTLGMMGLNGLADALREQRKAVQEMVDGALATDEPRVVDIAEVLLHVDTFLNELADEEQRALRVTDVVAPVPAIGVNTTGVAQPRLTDLESRQVARALYGVGLNELEQVREAVVAEEPVTPLADQPPRLIALAGGLHMLGHEQAAVQLGQLAGVIEEAAHEPPEGGRLEALADVVTALESTLEAYRADQAASRYLEVADERLTELMATAGVAESSAFDELAGGETAVDFELGSTAEIAGQEAPLDVGLVGDLETARPDMEIDAPMEAVVEEAEAAPEDVTEAVEVAEAEPEPEPELEPEEAEPAVTELAEEAEAPLYPVLSEEYDAETLDIFLEEADEVVGTLQEQVPQWIANPSDGELLGDIRRAFHTLKGSGRLVGAMLIGEFAWGYESLLNRVIEGTREAGPELFGTLERVVAVLPGLVDQLRGGPSPGGEVSALMAAAEALGEGRPLPAEAAAVPLVEAPAVDEDATGDAGLAEEAVVESVEAEGAAPEDVTEAVEVAEAEPEPEPEPKPEPLAVPRIDSQLYAIFQHESEAHLDTILSFVARARAGESAVPTEGVVRALHTLRGSSSMPEAQSIARLAEALEEQYKPRLATGEALTVQGVEQLGDATDLIRQVVLALGDRELPLPESDGLLDRINAAEGTDEAALEASTNELLIHGADLIDLLDDGVSRWVAASADNEPLRQLADEAAEVARQAAEVGQPAIAEVCALLETFAGLLANGRFGPEGEILALLGDTGSGLTEMFDSLAVSRPIDPDPLLVIGLRSRIDDAHRTDESSEPEPEIAATEPEAVAAQAEDAAPVQPTQTPDENTWSPESPLDPDLLEIFMEEGSELLDEAEATVHRWQEDVGDREAIALLQRQLHTLKGGARMAGIEPMGDLSHASESLLTGVVEGRLEPSDTLFEVLNESVDRLVGMLDSVRDDRPVSLASNLLEDLHDMASGEELSRTASPSPVAELRPDAEPQADTGAPGPADEPWAPETPLDPDLLEIFMEEGSELLDEAEATVHRWQEDVGDREAIALLQRQLHTLKGGARMAGIEPMGDLSHASESLLTGVVEGRLEPNERLFAELNAAVDRLAVMLDAVRHDRPLTHASGLREVLLALAEGRTPAPVSRPVLEPVPEVELPPAVPPPKQWSEAKPAESVDEAAKQAAPQAAARRAPAQQQEQVRVPAQLINSLVNLAGEVSIYRSRLEQQNNVMRFNLAEFEQTVERLREQLRTLEIETDAQIMSRLEAEGRTVEDFDPLEMDQYTALQTTSRALLESLNDLNNVREYLDDLSRESDVLLLQQSRVNTEIQQGLMQARMMPFTRLVPRMRRIVRQTAQEMGKKVELWVQGEQSEVDSVVVDRIIAPLEHLIRNAIAHGIESPEARQQAGKDPVGKLILTVDRDGSDIVFRVKDDGAGIDVDRVRQKAVERGLLAPDAEISEHDILQLIFESGMSTAKEVTQISGRGVGMDVVISEVRQLGGTVDINSKRGFGASFYLRIPFTLAVNRALLVDVGDELFAIPLTSIEGIVRLRADELEAYYGGEREHYTHAGNDYQVRHLGRLLGTSAPRLEAGQERIPVLLVRSGEQGMALHVDGLVGSREIVVKSVGPQLSSVRGLFGATILVDGRVALILDTNALALMGAQQEAVQARLEAVEQAVEVPQETTVMIVDDSITVRRVTARLLERHDFRVITAKDGVDALQVLQDEFPDIMLLDIEMPRMDGFELAQHIRGDSRLAKLPIIMITSRTGDKHRQRGMEIGVNRFLGKPYQDAELLENIRELTGTGETVDG